MAHRQTLRGPGSDRLLGYLQGMVEELVERHAEATETQREARSGSRRSKRRAASLLRRTGG